MSYQIRSATPADVEPLLELFPRLAAFTLPPQRRVEDLWEGDAALLRRWATGEAPGCIVHIAAAVDQPPLGVAIAQLRDELLSHEPSAHLEVLIVREGAEGQGIGAALMASIEQAAREQGAQSMTLHVFANNERARAVYARQGYAEELIRAIKHF